MNTRVVLFRSGGNRKRLRSTKKSRSNIERIEQLKKTDIGAKEREEQEQIEEQKKKAYDLEMARLEREAKERERLRKIEEHKEIKKKHAMERIEQLKKTDIGAKVLQNLDEELRTHLGHIHKHQHQTTAINLNNPESQGMHLETRLEQLDSAIKMELWQEAFKAVADIHGLIQLSKKSPKPSLMTSYRSKNSN
uniref:eIF3a PCI domain-containing protein n=1 Tax=Magallana gigas TaxID=29159 RepID=A0A8W8IPP5_MAGGI